MAQEGTSSNAPPAAASMGSGDGDNKEGTGESGNNQLLLPAIAASADKGKGVVAGTGNVDAKGKTTATPPAASSTNAPNNQGGGGGGGRSRERMHIFAERERRRKIKNMFTDLRDLVPSLTNKAFINVSVARRPGVLTMIVDVLERHSIDVVTAQIASDQSRSLFTIHTSVDRERGMFMDTATAEEIYQLAVSEIMVWLHSE
uniref:BHLH domain-containing protein n=1 Tax=Oryza barthii TaxID=65489 RepID=A0A0D3F675_9ORYZ